MGIAFVSAGTTTKSQSTAALSYPGSIANNDILLLFGECAQADTPDNATLTGAGWTQVTNSPVSVSGGSSGGAKLFVYWKRTTGSEGAVTLADAGDHQEVKVLAYRGCITSGSPIDGTPVASTETTSDTSGSATGMTTATPNAMVMVAMAGDLPDATGTANFSAWTNANLGSITERGDDTTNTGGGGALGICQGTKVAAGATGATTFTLASAAIKAMLVFALTPAPIEVAGDRSTTATMAATAAVLGTSPNLAWSNFKRSSGQDTTTLTSDAFTPNAGDVLVVKTATEDIVCTIGTVSGGGQIWTDRASVTSPSSHPAVKVTTATVSGSPGSMTVQCTFGGSGKYHSMQVERWTSAQLDASPAWNTVIQGGTGTAPSASVMTVADDSVVTVVDADWNARSPVGRAYTGDGYEEALDDRSTSFYVAYYWWQWAPTAGARSIGMTAPNTQNWSMLGVEVQYAAPGTNVDGTLAVTATTVAAASATHAVDGTCPVTATLSAAAAGVRPVDGTRPTTATLTAAASATHPVTGTLATTATLSADASVTSPGKNIDGTLAMTATPTAAATLSLPTSGTLVVTATLAGAAAGARPVDGTRATTATLTAAASGTRPVDGARTITATLAADASVVTPGSVSVDGIRPVTATLSAAANTVTTVAGTRAVTATLAADASVTPHGVVNVAGDRSITATVTAAAALVAGAGGSLPVTATLTGAANYITGTAATLATTATLVAAANVVPSVPPVTLRPDLGDTLRPSSGTTSCPYAGTTARP